jgi:hypothetical protein
MATKKTLKQSREAAQATLPENIPAAELTNEEVAVVEAERQEASAPDTPGVSPERLVEVWERRFVNPGAQPSSPIGISMPGMVVRWINTAIEGRYHRAVYEQGWQPVPVKLLQDPASIPDLFKHPHGIVCRGERGKEVLMMMPKQVFDKIQRRKAELNIKSLRNIRSEMAEAAGRQFGAEAGDFIHSGSTGDGNIKVVGGVQFGQERVSLNDRA